MDMTRHLRRWLNDKELKQMGGRYEGVVVAIREEKVRNRFTAQQEVQPVIKFDDGWLLIPNLGMRRALIEIFGAETNNWIGHRISVCRRRVERRDRLTGEVREKFEKFVYVVDPFTRQPIRELSIDVPRLAGHREPGDDDDAPFTADDIEGFGADSDLVESRQNGARVRAGR
jgi:hypothetical protein